MLTLKSNYLSFARLVLSSEPIVSEKVKQLSFLQIKSKRWAGPVPAKYATRRWGLKGVLLHPCRPQKKKKEKMSHELGRANRLRGLPAFWRKKKNNLIRKQKYRCGDKHSACGQLAAPDDFLLSTHCIAS